MFGIFRKAWLPGLILFLLPISLTSAPQRRIVAMGDVHGDIDRLTTILHKANILDAENRWVFPVRLLGMERGSQEQGGQWNFHRGSRSLASRADG